MCVQCEHDTRSNNKVLSLLLILDLAHSSSHVCILFVALCPYVSMGIVACLGQPLEINNVWTDCALIIIKLGNIHQSLSFVDQWEWDSTWIASLFVLEWGSSKKVNILFDSYWLSDKIQFLYWTFMPVTLFLMTVFDLLSLWYVELYRHFTAKQHLIILIDCCIWCLWVG